jgi:hypothetical protein
MAVLLDEGQTSLVNTFKKPPGQLPKYYSAAKKAKVRISTDFEAFLLLMGGPSRSDAVNWIQQARLYAAADADRDSLVATSLTNDLVDAIACQAELQPIFDAFQEFKSSFNLAGFEQVPECGLLIADLQRPMNEFQIMGGRLLHRQTFATLALASLHTHGVTNDHLSELNSWSGPLTAY